MKKLPTTTCSFRKIITENFLYIDKTKHIYDLINNDDHYFLSRPRRFGKSLLISTLKELFAGNRDLFKGLWIDSSDYDWPEHPVISLDFSRLNADSPEELKRSLAVRLDFAAKAFGIDISMYSVPGDKLEMLITALAEKNSVVVLIDEYDFVLVKKLTDLPVAQANLEVLSSFFAVLKSLEQYLRAIFLTGVSKFSQANVFSGLNNLNDISLDPIASSLLGYTEEELNTYFSSYINRLRLVKNKSEEEMRTKIRQWYNGYRFSSKPEKVYNPFSVHYLFKKDAFANYWFETATPSFLVRELEAKQYTLQDLKEDRFSMEDLGGIALGELALENLLFQTGYLTISNYDDTTKNYTLDFPNLEVKESLLFHLFSAFSKVKSSLYKKGNYPGF